MLIRNMNQKLLLVNHNLRNIAGIRKTKWYFYLYGLL